MHFTHTSEYTASVNIEPCKPQQLVVNILQSWCAKTAGVQNLGFCWTKERGSGQPRLQYTLQNGSTNSTLQGKMESRPRRKKLRRSPRLAVRKRRRGTNLLNLPLPVLAQIAALVSGGTPCPVAKFAFQVTCQEHHWTNLRALKATCTLLRDAADLAVAGLDDFMIAGKGTVPRPWEITFEIATALPCLVQLVKTLGQGTDELIRYSSGLRHVTLGEVTHALVDQADLCYALAASSSKTLQVLHLCAIDTDATNALLESLKGNLRELHLERYRNQAVLLSEKASSSLVRFAITNCNGIDDLLVTVLQRAKGLISLTLALCDFSSPNKLNCISDAPNLEELEFQGFEEVEHQCHIAKAVATGHLTKLKKLEYTVYEDSDMALIIPMLSAVSEELRHLKISLWNGLQSEEMRAFVGVPFREDCEMSLLVFGRHWDLTASSSIRPLLAFKRLVNLELDISSCKLLHLHELIQIDALKELTLVNCRFDYTSLSRLCNSSASINKLELRDCYHSNTEVIVSTTGSHELDLEDVRSGNVAGV